MRSANADHKCDPQKEQKQWWKWRKIWSVSVSPRWDTYSSISMYGVSSFHLCLWHASMRCFGSLWHWDAPLWRTSIWNSLVTIALALEAIFLLDCIVSCIDKSHEFIKKDIIYGVRDCVRLIHNRYVTLETLTFGIVMIGLESYRSDTWE